MTSRARQHHQSGRVALADAFPEDRLEPERHRLDDRIECLADLIGLRVRCRGGGGEREQR